MIAVIFGGVMNIVIRPGGWIVKVPKIQKKGKKRLSLRVVGELLSRVIGMGQMLPWTSTKDAGEESTKAARAPGAP